MILVLDVGNTETTIGIFENEVLAKRWSVSTSLKRTSDEWAVLIRMLIEGEKYSASEIFGVAVSSVVPPVDFNVKNAFLKHFGIDPLFVSPGIKTGLNILYENPLEVGADRVVNAVAAVKSYKLPCIVIDFGTATTFDVIDRTGNYLGGVICPGLNISAEALFTRTAKLPKVEIGKPKKVVGRTTVSSIQSGLFYGYISLVEGVIKRIKGEIGEISTIVATGGISLLLAQECPSIDDVDEDLTLKGLHLIYEKNR
ncbi:MAG: type III pantothenate kinase [Acidobacteria bacterium]|nr:type III pantothenate kinase [Acidobacteriota bacterium]